MAAAEWAPGVAALVADREEDPWVREEAVRALGASGDAARAPTLIAALREDRLPGDLVRDALRALLRTSSPGGPDEWESWFEKNRPDRALVVFSCSHGRLRWIQRGPAPRRCPLCGPRHPGCGVLVAALTEKTLVTWRCPCRDATFVRKAAEGPPGACPDCPSPAACSLLDSWREPPEERD